MVAKKHFFKEWTFVCLILGSFLCMGQSCQKDCDNGTSEWEEAWESSGHADSTAEAFNHWNEDDPAEIPTSCAKCHSADGFLDFVGADGTEAGVVDNPAPIGTVISCEVCHNSESQDSVTFPSGVVIEDLGKEGICMTCHQGRKSTADVDSAIADAAVEDDDTVNEEIGFQNIHYYAAGATLNGSVVMGGYQYDGNTYDAKLNHVAGYDTCTDCHDKHTLKIKVEECSTCHTNVASEDDLHDIRFFGSLNVDYDGDGNITEGIYYELTDMQEKLYDAIQAYASDVAGLDIVYDAHSYPYFFGDTNGNGEADEDESGYSAFTPRLLKAAYNYQVSQKDPGAFAHGGKYIIQLLYDSIEDLGDTVDDLTRNDEGHFDGSAEAWRHWDEDDPQVVSASCSKCHAKDGLANFLATGEEAEGEIANGMTCSNCHDNVTTFTRRAVGEVTFPSGLTADMGDDSNLCISCHQGRESKSSVDAAEPADDGTYGFTNIHYIAVGAVLYGTDVKGGYEYDGKTYVGQRMFSAHGGNFDTCVECHMGTKGAESDIFHNVHKPNQADCVACHGTNAPQPNPGSDPDQFKFSGIRMNTVDYDGDGSTTEKLGDEVATLEDALYAQIQAYANAQGKPIVYDDHSYPYFFFDTDGDGETDEDEASYDNKYGFDLTLLKAAYNLQFSKKEPHGYIHNLKYIVQLLVDSIEDLGGDVSKYSRP